MATSRIRTLNFLPEIFKTVSNNQFLKATLDQVVAQPNLTKVEGYIGNTFGYGVNALSKYVTEPSKVRTDYQLDPGVVFTKTNNSAAQDFISYPGIIDALALEGGVVGNNSRMLSGEYYSWDSFSDLDKLANFNQYYWLPNGAEQVVVGAATVFNSADYIVNNIVNAYTLTVEGEDAAPSNPTLTLLRGGTYTFAVNQDSEFWIQGEPGLTGYDPQAPNVQTREVYGVERNGSKNGYITFTVPDKTAQDMYNFPGNNQIDVVSTIPYDQVNGKLASSLVNGIDGITSLNGRTLMFYNTGVVGEQGYISAFYDTTTFDQIDPALVDGFGNYEGGKYVDVSAVFFLITYVGEANNPVIKLTEYAPIPTNEKIIPIFGTEWISRTFYRSTAGAIKLVPYISANLDVLYYQDSTQSTKVGILKIIDSNSLNTINVPEDILGKKQYTSTNGVVFTNGLKIIFAGSIYPESYKNVPYYVEGVGTAIELVPVSDLVAPETFTAGSYIPYDTVGYDTTNYDSSLYVPIDHDYITIARNAACRNAWARSNRWFHVDVITATAGYNKNPSLLTSLITYANKAKRPIIEFNPNLKLINSGIVGKAPIDFIDFRATDALFTVAGKQNYYPDVETYTSEEANITGVVALAPGIASSTTTGDNFITLGTGTTSGYHLNDRVTFTNGILGGLEETLLVFPFTSTTYYIRDILSIDQFTVSLSIDGPVVPLTSEVGTMTVNVVPFSTTLTIPATAITGSFQIGHFITDTSNSLPRNAFITGITGSTVLTLTVSWSNMSLPVPSISGVGLVSTEYSVDNYALFDGARVIFANDANPEVRNKIYVARLVATDNTTTETSIALTEASDGEVLPNNQTFTFRGYNYIGRAFYYTGTEWLLAQQKTNVNQSPLFDVFDANGISLNDHAHYTGSSFEGSALFKYGLGTGTSDSVLGFPLRYSSIANEGDISFSVAFNEDTFDYVRGSTPVTEHVNIGYVHSYTSLTEFERKLGWQTAIAPSVQYQIFEFNYLAESPTNTFVCDVPMKTGDENSWPSIQLFVNNATQSNNSFTVAVDAKNTTVSFTVPNQSEDTVIQILLLSDSVSKTAHYGTPINLNNNPLNSNVESLNVGDIRRQYHSIFCNSPDTAGNAFGSNNFRDLGNLVPYGSTIIQNSASMVLPATFLRKQNHNLFNALMFNSREYINFKTLLVSTINSADFSVYQTPAYMLDYALDQITATKTNNNSFFWSDMIPSKAAFITNTYTFGNTMDVSIYPLSRIYDYSVANYYGVLVYLTRKISGFIQNIQLVRGVDYTISTDSPSLTITTDLQTDDQITVREYNQTYGSYVPNTPTKLGLYPSTIPKIVLDSSYMTPTWFLVGHDGSYNKLFGDYYPTTGRIVDFRDQALFEFEKRVYNNLKISAEIPVHEHDVIPGFFRKTEFSTAEIQSIYSTGFLNWIGQNRIEFKQQVYDTNQPFTYNYYQSGNKLDGRMIDQGYWRGVYHYFYDTTTPDTTPWEMLGYTDKPTWWETRYGAAPYTSENLVLWGDLEAGISWNDGSPTVIETARRPGLLKIIPVDTAGNLLSPFDSIVGNYTGTTMRNDWKVGDMAPAEFSYRRSSSWPFDLMRILALTKPAQFFNLAADLDNYKHSEEFGQYLVNNRKHLIVSEIEVYGSGTPKTSYINWIVDFEKQVGIDATSVITDLLRNIDVRLIYRLAGFSDKNLLKFYVEKGTKNNTTNSLLVPDESYSVMVYDNQPFERIIYSSAIIQITDHGYKVFGNSQTNAYFTVLKPKINGNYEKVTIEKVSVQIANDYTNIREVVPYGTEFTSIQAVAQFLASYGKYLESLGCVFDQIQSGIEITWPQMVAEYLYWSQTGWEIGSVINVNPAAELLTIDKSNNIVQPLTLRQQNFVLNQNLYPIQSADLSVVRDGTLFAVKPLLQGDTISYGVFNISNFEHGVVFDNITLFDDVVYNLTTGLRQNRIILKGSKTADWDGTVDAQGFILNQDNIAEWSPNTKYAAGSIVKFKNRYWITVKSLQASEKFDETSWKQTDYNTIQKGLLPNPSTRSYESTLYYDINKANLENDGDLLAFSLIGYRPRDYLASADLTDITQVNVFRNMIKNKGTTNAANVFKGSTLSQGKIDYDIYENWAIKAGEYGGVLNSNYVEMRLNEAKLTGNPAIISLSNGTSVDGSHEEIQLYSLYNYGRPVSTPNVLPVLDGISPTAIYPDAGYVNFDDVKISSYYYSGLPTAVDSNGTPVPVTTLFVRDYVWIASYQGTWQVYTPSSLGQITSASNNLNGTITVTFAQEHGMTKYQPFAIVNFNSGVDGYHLVSEVNDPFRVSISLSVTGDAVISGSGTGFKFQTCRVATPSDIADLPLLDSEYINNKVWVDENIDGGWAVYSKNINYTYRNEITKPATTTFGSAVAYSEKLGYLLSDAANGKVYRYVYDAMKAKMTPNNPYILSQTLEPANVDITFGTTIQHVDDLVVISQPTVSPRVYVYKLESTLLVNELVLVQELLPGGVVGEWGKGIAISGDKNWIYVSDTYENNTIFCYRKEAAKLWQVTGLKIDRKYKITELGTTDFAALGAPTAAEFAATLSGNTMMVTDVYGGFIDVGQQLSGIGITPGTTITSFVSPGNYLLSDAHDLVSTDLSTMSVGTEFVGNGPGTGTGKALDISLEYSLQNSFSVDDLTPTDDFGHTVATSHYGDLLVVGAPNINYDVNTENWGKSFVFSRFAQRYEAQFDSSAYSIQQIPLQWYPLTAQVIATDTTAGTNIITCGVILTIYDGCPVVFSDAVIPGCGLVANTVYYVLPGYTSTTFSVTTERGGAPVELMTATGTMQINVQRGPLFVEVNGIPISDNNYGVIDNILYVSGGLDAGDILSVSGSEFVLQQTLTTETTPRIGVHFGNSVDMDVSGSEIIVGAPYELNTAQQNNQNIEGAVYRFTNSGAKYGTIIGTAACNITNPVFVLLNGYPVELPIGNAAAVAAAINAAVITNIQASSLDGNKIFISLIDNNLATVNNKLMLVAIDTLTLEELGVTTYTQTQVIKPPHIGSRTQFGTTVKFNEFGSFVVSAPASIRHSGTTFDFTDDALNDNDTLFDNNATRWIDMANNAGAVYMYDYLSVYNESLDKLGKYVYAQSVNDKSISYGLQPMFGTALEFNNNQVVIGTPGFKPNDIGGQVITFMNDSGKADWSVLRSTSPVVDIARVKDIQLYSATTNTTLDNLDYIDPLQGKLLGVVSQNIDVVSNQDPAGYNATDVTNPGAMVWGTPHVGMMWFDTSRTRFVNYHQNDVTYDSKYWGRVFPGSDVAIYSWIYSAVPPNQYTGNGTPMDETLYSIEYEMTASEALVAKYFFWVRNSNTVFTNLNKTLADSAIEAYISSPSTSGIGYFAPLRPNTFGLYNVADNINATDTVLHVGYSTGLNDDASHNMFNLIRTDYADDFLPGIPPVASGRAPESLYNKLLDSLCGCDSVGEIVPNPFLPKPVQNGIQSSPKQSFFVNRLRALKNYLSYANDILSKHPIAESRHPVFLFKETASYNTTNYWNYVSWWAPGYDDNTKTTLQVNTYSDLASVMAPSGTLVTVLLNGDGKSETYAKTSTGWTRVGLKDGTIKFDLALWDYAAARTGFGDNFFDTIPYDEFPSEETRNIIRSLSEEIYVNELLIHRNKSLILLFEYIQSETLDTLNYMPWLNKTSFIDVSHTVRELLPISVLQSDNQEFLSGYMNEVKPYHVTIKEFLFKYTGTDTFTGNITDFDLPSKYDSATEKFITPELVFNNPSSSQYGLTDPIWQTTPYDAWFANYGLSITGVDNFEITTLLSHIATNASEFTVDNAFGLPTTGVLLIDQELIGYAIVDRAKSTVGALTRGINGTAITYHDPGAKISINLPAVLLLDGGRGYVEPPKVTAYIDTSIYPAPTRPAELVAVMNLDTILRIDVVDPGQGYAVLPEIMIEPSMTIPFIDSYVNIATNSISLQSPLSLLETGDLVKYTVGADSTPVGGLINGQYYYVAVLDITPTFIVALYSNYANAINDIDRVRLLDPGTGTHHALAVSARASCVSTAVPIRASQIELRFDRVAYSSRMTDWRSGAFYGAFFAGRLNHLYYLASSSIKLQNVLPDINTITVAASGGVFEIDHVRSDDTLVWSSRTRQVLETVDTDDSIVIGPSEGGALFEGTVAPTTGFYIGMPIKFSGPVFGGLEIDITYYVESIISGEHFTIMDSDTNHVALTSALVGVIPVVCYTGRIDSVAVVNINYPGILEVTKTTATLNEITVPLTASGQGGTNDFYVGLPIIFTGELFGNIVENDQYYVTTVVDNQTFTISTDATPTLIDVTETETGTNIITCESTVTLSENDPVKFTEMKIGGGNVTSFGGLISGRTYYISSLVYGSTMFTVSATIGGPEVTLSSAMGSCVCTNQKNTLALSNATGSATVHLNLPVSPGQITGQQFTFYPTSKEYAAPSSTDKASSYLSRTVVHTIEAPYNYLMLAGAANVAVDNMYVNMPVTFEVTFNGITAYTMYYIGSTNIIVATVESSASSTDAFTCDSTMGFYVGMPLVFSNQEIGGVTLGDTYYVESIVDSTHFTISDLPGGAFRPLVTQVGTMILTGPAYVTVQTSPGGAEVALTSGATANYSMTQLPTSSPVFGVSYILGGYRVVTTDPGSGYAVGNEITIPGTEINEPGATEANDLSMVVSKVGIEVTASETSGGAVICSSTFGMREGDPIQFTNMIVDGNPEVTFGGINSVVESGFFEIGCTYTITSLGDTDVFTSIGADHNRVGEIFIATGVGSVDPLATAQQTYFIDWIVDSTSIEISTVYGNAVLSPSAALGTMTVTCNNGAINSVIVSGEPAEAGSSYYLKVISANDCEVYSDPKLTMPVRGEDFRFVGITRTEVIGTDFSSNAVIGATAFEFEANEPVVFTGDIFDANIVLGRVYYVKDYLYPNWITISETIGGPELSLAGGTGSCTIAKSGDFILLPEPFYFDQSLVRYDNRVYQCIISNNDPEFIFGKWQLLRSSDRQLNALDRIYGYYQPTVNMPGLDMTQLVDGITYPNSTYMGNSFAPDENYDVDTILKDRQFYPTSINTMSVVWNGTDYVAASDTPEYSAVITSPTVEEWEIDRLAGLKLNVTDMIYSGGTLLSGGTYVITTRNRATPIIVSHDGLTWTTNGAYTPYGVTTFDELPYDMTSLDIASISLNSVAHHNGLFVAVGENIVTSNDAFAWTERYAFTDNGLPQSLNSVAYVSIDAFRGFIAVGGGSRLTVPSDPFSTAPVNLLLTSLTGQTWTSPSNILTSATLNAVTSTDTKILVMGASGARFSSTNASNWTDLTAGYTSTINDVVYAGLLSATRVYDTVSYNNRVTVEDSSDYEVNDPVVFAGETFGGIVAGTTYYVHSIYNSTSLTLSAIPGGPVFTLTDPTGTSPICMMTKAMFVAVGDNGVIETSPDGVNWVTRVTDTTEKLNGVTWATKITYLPYDIDSNLYDGTPFDASAIFELVVAGDNNTILRSSNGIDWISSSVFAVEDSTYTVQGDPFIAGYGPEELVPGVVSDNLTMFVTTRPGTNWNATEYAHVGYNVVSKEVTPAVGQTVFSFDNMVSIPAQLSVFISDDSTKLSTRTFAYTTDWINKTITIPGTLAAGHSLRIDVYEVGNGDQLVRSNSDNNPIRLNTITGFSEISLNCNYSATIFSGSGLIRPDTGSITTLAFATDAVDDTVECASVFNFVLNQPVSFHGNVFGGLVSHVGITTVATDTTTGTNLVTCISTDGFTEGHRVVFNGVAFGNIVSGDSYYVLDVVSPTQFTISTTAGGPEFALTTASGSIDMHVGMIYFVKSISNPTNKITLSESKVSGVAGPVFPLTDATGVMDVSIHMGLGLLWTPPNVTNNGTKLFLGQSNIISGTDSTTNTVICDSTMGMVDGDRITFSDTISGDVLVPHTEYFIKSVVNDNAFTVSTTSGGSLISLSNSTGSAQSITNDFAIDVAGNGISAKIVFASTITHQNNYVAFALFGETQTEQYGYTVPEVEVLSCVGTPTVFALANFVSGDNPMSAIVEQNGVRLTSSEYTIDPVYNTLTLSTAPLNTDVVSVTSYNLTERQYLHTTYGITSNVVSNIVNVDNVIGAPLAIAYVTAIDATTDVITCTSTDSFISNQTVEFKTTVVGTIGNIQLGKPYFVLSILSPTTFTVSETPGGALFDAASVNWTGFVMATVGGRPAVRVTVGAGGHNFVENSIVRIDGTNGSLQLNNATFYVHVITDSVIDLYLNEYITLVSHNNSPVTTISAWTNSGYIWLDRTFILKCIDVTATDISNEVTCVSTETLVVGTPIHFTGTGFGGINTIVNSGSFVNGRTYIINTIGTTDFTLIGATSNTPGETFIATSMGSGDGTAIQVLFVQSVIDSTTFTLSYEYTLLNTLALTTDVGTLIGTQWSQQNVDRLWVTVNGYRVASSALRLNPGNNLSILTTITPGDEVIITNMIPTSSPAELAYILQVDKLGAGSVYRANPQTKTWVTESISPLDPVIYVHDVNMLIRSSEQVVIAGAPVDGITRVGLVADKRMITYYSVFNVTTSTTVDPAYVILRVEELSPMLLISGQVAIGDELRISIKEGNLVYINGELIRFTGVDIVENTLTGIRRGQGGTGVVTDIPLYTEAYGLLNQNKLPVTEYSNSWNSVDFAEITGQVGGLPLQISTTDGAAFLNRV